MNILLSVFPILLLFVLMLGVKMAGHKSAFLTLVATLLIAWLAAPALGFAPENYTQGGVMWAFVEGILKATFPILIIILMAIYSYNTLLESGEIEVIKKQFTSLTNDRGIIVLLLVWGFGGLLEGMAGFGTAVAIPAAILIGLGFKPGFSALVSLIANSVPTGFGAVGVPVTTLANEVAPSGCATPEAICDIASKVVIQLSPLMLLIPFVILTLTDSSPKKIKTHPAFSMGRRYFAGSTIYMRTIFGRRDAGHPRKRGSHLSHCSLCTSFCRQTRCCDLFGCRSTHYLVAGITSVECLRAHSVFYSHQRTFGQTYQ